MNTRSGKKTAEKEASPNKPHGEEGDEKAIWELLCIIRADISKILEENKQQSQVIQELKESIEFEAEKRISLEKNVKKLEDDLKITRDALKESEERRMLEEGKLDDLEQYTRKYNLEVSGLGMDKHNSDRELVLSMAKAMNVDLDDKDMDIVHRLKVKNDNPPIIIRFSSYQAKQRLYKARKLTRDIDWSVIFGYSTTVYINENLTKKRRSLFMETRREVKKNHWYGCWTIDGKIFLKKSEESRPYIIHRAEDINKS